jgi:mRNA interferase MazF
VLSNGAFNRDGQTILAMVTSARHNKRAGDIRVPAGTASLPKDSLIRMKLFTLDNRLIERSLGMLPESIGDRMGAQIQAILKRPR